jgi:hypothetical protein
MYFSLQSFILTPSHLHLSKFHALIPFLLFSSHFLHNLIKEHAKLSFSRESQVCVSQFHLTLVLSLTVSTHLERRQSASTHFRAANKARKTNFCSVIHDTHFCWKVERCRMKGISHSLDDGWLGDSLLL